MQFRPGQLSNPEAAELNRMRAKVKLLEEIKVSAPLRLVKSPSGWSIQQGDSSDDGTVVLVKCNSATAAAGSGVGAECYDATIKMTAAGTVLTSFADGADVWLTVAGVSGPAVPEANRYYVVIAVNGTVEAATGDTRQRVIGQEAGMSEGDWLTVEPVTDVTIACEFGDVTIDVTTLTGYDFWVRSTPP
jgi:hypothetical protein